MVNQKHGNKPLLTVQGVLHTIFAVNLTFDNVRTGEIFTHIVVDADGDGETPASRTLAYLVEEGSNGEPTGRLLSVFAVEMQLPDGSRYQMKSLRPQ